MQLYQNCKNGTKSRKASHICQEKALHERERHIFGNLARFSYNALLIVNVLLSKKLKSRVLFNIIHCFWMFVNKPFIYHRRVYLKM